MFPSPKHKLSVKACLSKSDKLSFLSQQGSFPNKVYTHVCKFGLKFTFWFRIKEADF